MGRARDVRRAEGLRQASRLWQNDSLKFRRALLFPPFSCGLSAVLDGMDVAPYCLGWRGVSSAAKVFFAKRFSQKFSAVSSPCSRDEEILRKCRHFRSLRLIAICEPLFVFSTSSRFAKQKGHNGQRNGIRPGASRKASGA